jgi:serine phosphatase RsbU (regulator of sigma subunit)
MDSSSQPERRGRTTTQTLRTALNRLAPADIDRLHQFATLKTYPVDTILCREGRIEHTFYIVHSGSVKITQRVSDTEERMLTLRGPGEFFGEMALVDDSPRSATVTAATDVAVIEITDEIFDQVLENSPALARMLLLKVLSMLRENLQSQILELQAKNSALEQAYQDLQAAQAERVRAERVKRDLELAAQVQRSILPESFPSLPGLTFAAHAQPAREMGGDFYDVFRLDERHLGLLIADVSDKSIHAAIFMAVARTLFLTEARRSLSPREVVLSVNDLLMDVSSADDMFVTAFYGVLHLDDRRLTYVRAGHDRPLLQHADGQAHSLEGGGRFLGMLDGLEVEEQAVDLRPGDRLILYSDGVPDTTNAAGERYGPRRLRSLVEQRRAASAGELADAILSDVLEFQGDAQQFDDITLLVAAID